MIFLLADMACKPRSWCRISWTIGPLVLLYGRHVLRVLFVAASASLVTPATSIFIVTIPGVPGPIAIATSSVSSDNLVN